MWFSGSDFCLTHKEVPGSIPGCTNFFVLLSTCRRSTDVWHYENLDILLPIIRTGSFFACSHFLCIANTMVEDKYIGLALAVSSSLAIGTSFIITKKVSVHFHPNTSQPVHSITSTPGTQRCGGEKCLRCSGI